MQHDIFSWLIIDGILDERSRIPRRSTKLLTSTKTVLSRYWACFFFGRKTPKSGQEVSKCGQVEIGWQWF